MIAHYDQHICYSKWIKGNENVINKQIEGLGQFLVCDVRLNMNPLNQHYMNNLPSKATNPILN